MTIKKKESKPAYTQMDIDEAIERVIDKGGKTTEDKPAGITICSQEVRFTMRIPGSLLVKIDQKRKERVGNLSRNQWILETLAKALE